MQSQTIYKYEQKNADGSLGATLTFFSKDQSKYIPHLVRQYNTGKALHNQVWGLDSTYIQPPFMLLSDWEDDGNGGVTPIPHNIISIGMAPLNMSYFVSPSIERYSHLFRHEYTHIVMTDRPSQRDMAWRKFFGTKVSADSMYPLSSVWSYMTVPRWYSPRWYHEGIACFMETWLSGGVGRALGGYDEMYFRTMVREGSRMSTVVGLESEGTTQDFQIGVNSYLYGTRFVNYLAMKYGYGKLIDFYNRTPESHAFFASQFKEVYGRRIRDVWDEWIEYEHGHQQRNIRDLREFPLTRTEGVIPEGKSLGSASALVVDDSAMVAFTAVNYPGDISHIERIDLRSGTRTRLDNIDGPMMYQTSYLTYDRRRQRLLWTDRNNSIRGIRTRYLNKDGKNQHLKFQRVSNIVYDNAGDLLYGLMTNEGVVHIVCYDSDLADRKILYTFPFGTSVSDLDVSHDGRLLSATVVGQKGDCSIAVFKVEDLQNASFGYTILYSQEDGALMQFRFAKDDKTLVGTSYYTGVANVWEIPLSDHQVDVDSLRLLSNVETGLFAPYKVSDSEIYAFEFTRDGMYPVRFAYSQISDCNAIELLGQKVFEANPQLETLSRLDKPLEEIAFGDVYDSIRVYRPLNEMHFHGVYPDISGFVDRKAWNNVTPVLSCHLNFTDNLGLSNLNIALGISPWSNNAWKNRFHLNAEWKYWKWTFTASWNKTDFNDLFGPMHQSRKGYQIGASYDCTNTIQRPYIWKWGASLNAFGDLDALPLYQNIAVDEGIRSLQTASAYIELSRLRSSLGATQPEQGYSFMLQGYSYLAGGELFPSMTLSLDEGVLLPFMRNTSAWLRLAAGQNFGNVNSVFGSEYFGGFRNNYVDRGSVYRYRSVSSMPGVGIDAIGAHSFCKATAELNLQPLRFRNIGLLCLYPTYVQMSVFATDLAANPWGKMKFENFATLGAQINMEIVLFNYMKTTWSAGYAHIVDGTVPYGGKNGQWMLSLKLL